MNEDYRMDIFDAVALAFMFREAVHGQDQSPKRIGA
jgi:hypothetical protein